MSPSSRSCISSMMKIRPERFSASARQRSSISSSRSTSIDPESARPWLRLTPISMPVTPSFAEKEAMLPSAATSRSPAPRRFSFRPACSKLRASLARTLPALPQRPCLQENHHEFCVFGLPTKLVQQHRFSHPAKPCRTIPPGRAVAAGSWPAADRRHRSHSGAQPAQRAVAPEPGEYGFKALSISRTIRQYPAFWICTYSRGFRAWGHGSPAQSAWP